MTVLEHVTKIHKFCMDEIALMDKDGHLDLSAEKKQVCMIVDEFEDDLERFMNLIKIKETQNGTG